MTKADEKRIAISLMLVVTMFLVIRIWASNMEIEQVGPTIVKKGSDGVVYILSDNTLYLHSVEGFLRNVVPMEKFGISQYIGDFWVYGNSEILLRREVSQKPSFWREIEMFLRIGSGEQDKLSANESILQRCNIYTYICKPFGAGEDAFKKISTFKVYADAGSGYTYIADSLEHQLLLLDQNGSIIRESTVPLKFPNQMIESEATTSAQISPLSNPTEISFFTRER